MGPLGYWLHWLHLWSGGSHACIAVVVSNPHPWEVPSYSLGPEVEFLVDELDELRVAEGEEVDNLIDASQKFIPPEVSLQAR